VRAELAGPPVSSVASQGTFTLGGFAKQVCSAHSEREALVFDDPLRGGQTVRWSYRELLRQARAVAGALIAQQVVPGDRVAILMANRPEAVAAFFGAAMTGAVVTPLSTFSTTHELAQLLALAKPSVVLGQTTMGSRDFAADMAGLDYPAVWVGRDWDTFLAHGSATREQAIDDAIAAVTPDCDGLLIFSSGTTATPKGVVHGHRAPTLQFWIPGCGPRSRFSGPQA
jgi:fatty-acyl-CoA synthase